MIKFLNLQKLNIELKDEYIESLNLLLERGQYISGLESEEFENEFSKFCGTKYCIGVGNGLDALEIILKSLGIGPGDEVIVPSHTFIATWLAVTNVGARPIPVNVDVEKYNINPENLHQALTNNTKAIIGVHLYGRLFEANDLQKFCAKNNLHLIEDAAQAHGASTAEHCAGNIGIAAAFSFYPGKNLGALGDGGAITTNCEQLAKTAREISNYGSCERYQHIRIGTNSRLDSLQASFLKIKLRKLNSWNSRRNEIAEMYIKGLKGLLNFELPQLAEGHVWHLFVCKFPLRDKLLKLLKNDGIDCQIHYPKAILDQPAYEDYKYKTSYDIEIDRYLANSIISLPIDPMLSNSDVDHIIKNVVKNVNVLNSDS